MLASQYDRRFEKIVENSFRSREVAEFAEFRVEALWPGGDTPAIVLPMSTFPIAAHPET
jgi:hypothetical protein